MFIKAIVYESAIVESVVYKISENFALKDTGKEVRLIELKEGVVPDKYAVGEFEILCDSVKNDKDKLKRISDILFSKNLFDFFKAKMLSDISFPLENNEISTLFKKEMEK